MIFNRLVPMTCLAVSLLGCATPAQLMRDALVDKLCAADGGAHVYQTLPGSLRNQVAVPFKPPKERDLFIFKTSSKNIEGSDSGVDLVWRSSTGLYRISDGELLAEYITYHRRGWDSLRAHPSSYTCPTLHGMNSMLDAVFVENGDK